MKISNAYLPSVRECRQEFKKQVAKRAEKWKISDSVKTTYPVEVEILKYSTGIASKYCSFWLVSQYHAGREDALVGVSTTDDHVYLPLAGVAVLVPVAGQQQAMYARASRTYILLSAIAVGNAKPHGT